MLGYCYVCAWSISIYPPLWNNWKRRSASAMSLDFVMLNSVGYFYLICSLWLQLFHWQETEMEDNSLRPKVTHFDFWYCLHGFVMNLVLTTQVLWGTTIWKFQGGAARMKAVYRRVLLGSILMAVILLIQFVYQNTIQGWSNQNTLSFCNHLFLLKISMSLLKYIPQVKHNYDRKSMRGFPIQSVMCDVLGGVCSMWQLAIQLSKEARGFTFVALIANFGKIGIAIVTLFFNFIYISQWIIYGEQSK